MALIEKSRNYTCKQIVEQETIKAFYDKLYETFNSRPYLYDICKDLIENGPSDYRDFDLYTLNKSNYYVKIIKNGESYSASCYKNIKIASKIYNNAYIRFTYKYQVKIASRTYILNVSVFLQFDHGKPVFSAFCINKYDNSALLRIKDYYHTLDYRFSNRILDEKDDAKIEGFISYNDSDRNLDVNISPSDFAYGIRKAIIS